MKSLWKISCRYILTAVFIILFALCVNFVAMFYVGGKAMSQKDENSLFSRTQLDEISAQLRQKDGNYIMSDAGYGMLKNSVFIWAMQISEEGDVEWSYELPEEIPTHYSLSDVAVFSRWYLKDYPVYVWKNENSLMVFGCAKDSIARMASVYDIPMLNQIPSTIMKFAIINVILIVGLALLFGWRFYHALKPIAGGIEALSEKKVVSLPERGITNELAAKLNQTSALLRSQDQKLEQRDNARTSWIAGVSHDIRTPLALITGYSDEILHNRVLDEDTRKRAEIIQNQSLLIKQLIEDLNLTSKLEYQAQPLHRELVSPAVLLRTCVAEYYNQGIQPQYEIEIDIDPKVEKQKIDGDERLLLRAFRNLIGNSIRHNKKGCKINVHLESTAAGAEFTFTDTGEGVPSVVIDALSGSETLQKSSVHVMGLRIVKQIIAAHGGRTEFLMRKSGNGDVVLKLPYV